MRVGCGLCLDEMDICTNARRCIQEKRSCRGMGSTELAYDGIRIA